QESSGKNAAARHAKFSNSCALALYENAMLRPSTPQFTMVAIAVGFWLLSLLLPAMRPSGPHSVTGLDVLYHSTLYVVQGVWSYALGGFTTAMAAVAAFLNWAFLVSACIMLWTDRHIHGAWVLLIAATILGLSYVH